MNAKLLIYILITSGNGNSYAANQNKEIGHILPMS